MGVQTIDFNGFMKRDWRSPAVSERTMAGIGATSVATLLPKTVLAGSADAISGNIFGSIMKAFDAGVVLVIIFAGASWCLGHRGKAIEILIGVCCGYVLARHAVDIRDFLKGI